MGERRALGEAGGAAGELDVDSIVRPERGGGAFQCLPIGGREEGLPRQETGVRFRSDGDDAAQMRQAIPADLAQHGEVVARLEPGGGDEHAAADLVQRVLDFVDPVGRVDRDEDGADPCGGELDQRPFRAVGRPDADAVPLGDAKLQQTGCHLIDCGIERGPRIALALMA